MSENNVNIPEKTPRKAKKHKNSTTLNVLRNLLSMLRHNWWQKLACLVLAVALWGIIISQNTSLTRSKTFTDVPIQVQRTSLTNLRQSGLIVTSGLDDLPPVTFTAEVPQKNYNSVTENTYSVRLDLSQVKEPGVQMVPLISTGSAAYGNVTRLSVEQVEVTVEEYITRSRIPVTVEYVNGVRDGWYADTPKADPSVVSVAGPAEKVRSITRCVALVDLSNVESVPYLMNTAAEFILYSDKTPVDLTNISVGVSGQTTVIDSIIVEQGVYPEFALPVNTDGLIRGTPAQGMEVKSVTLSDTELLAAMESGECTEQFLTLNGSIDISGASGTVNRTLNVTKPAGCRHLSKDAVRVTVEIGPVEEAAEAGENE